MSAFRKAKPKQAFLKIGIYGNSGSGKTFTSLLCAEGLAKLTGKRIAFIDTERGTDFYCQDVKDRYIHPKAFDFDAIYTRSIAEVTEAIQSLDDKEHGIIIIDSITHIWEAAKNAYSGKETSAGTIPFHAWAKIKKPYKYLINILLNCNMHVFICGRQGNEFDDEDGQLKKVGTKMKAEGETPYETHILLRMEAMRNPGNEPATITSFAEKDRTGIISGKVICNPSYKTLIEPIVGLLGETQAEIKSDEDVAIIDSEKLQEKELNKTLDSSKTLKEYLAKLTLCDNKESLKQISDEIKLIKKKLLTKDIAELREAFLIKETELKNK